MAKFFAKIARGILVIAWYLLGAWAALAAYFTAPVPFWAASLFGIGIAALFALALPRRSRQPRHVPSWHDWRLAGLALVVAGGMGIWFFGFVHPATDENWIPVHERVPVVTY